MNGGGKVPLATTGRQSSGSGITGGVWSMACGSAVALSSPKVPMQLSRGRSPASSTAEPEPKLRPCLMTWVRIVTAPGLPGER